jgi:sigma-B regulation protein RsbU (phosphoserine phosphatase)
MTTAPRPAAELLYDEAACGLLLADSDGVVLEVNTTLCSWLRRRREELVGTRRFQDLLTVGGRMFWQTHLQPLLRMQASVAEVKLDLQRSEGDPLPVMVNIAERNWEGQRLLHVALFVAEDRHKYERELLLQRKRAEDLAAQHARDQEELAEAHAQAEDRAQFAEQLVGMVSHDIRNPLSVIQMSAVLVARGVGPEQQQLALDRITRSVRRMQHLIGDLLDFSQARLGRGLSVNRREVELQQPIADAVSELAIAFPQSRIQQERNGEAQCHADPERIVQAIGNLVANAVNHGSPDQPITVRSEVGHGVFRISVHNAGAPIPPEVAPRLFEPMVRGAAHGASKGVGVGLFFVREIVRAHGGTVQVHSTEREGTTFWIELPLAGNQPVERAAL